MSAALLDTEIRYSRITKDYDILVAGAIVASAPNFSAAEAIRTQLLSERIQDGCYVTATELDGGADPTEGTPGIDDVAPGSPPESEPSEGRTNPIWPAQLLIGTHDLHMLAQTDPAEFRARLAALSDDALKTQAERYALYASILCDREISADETLEHFKLSVEVHRATQRSEDAVCQVLYELALTDALAMIEFLRGHTEPQREQLAWRFAAWLKRTCDITREPSHILKGWQQLIVGAAASGAERLQIELADCLGYAAGWDAVAAMWAGVDASAESYAALPSRR